MRRALSRAARSLSACASAAVLVTGCGVRGTGVVQAGGPATVAVVPASTGRVLLFFLSSKDKLMPVARDIHIDQPTDPVPGVKVLTMLFTGPTPAERTAGLHTGLPSHPGPLTATRSPGEVSVLVSFPVHPLTASAVRQLVCTAAFTDGEDGTAAVSVKGTDGSLPAARC
ncbi:MULTISPECIES: hypothetical protein [Streptomyces]|uniref:hypothetical protein n=1 Tax=Streptomyces TaxID=1883 RepID=UPI0007C7D9F5|nr:MULTISPECIES: hypothetical protein [Streptomyces]MCH0556445.1 hypothetical protein [Streptomyces sp. MUM 16J]